MGYYNSALSTIVVNGVTMTLAEYRKMKRAATNAKKKKKELSEIQLLPSDIKTLMKGVRVMKSLVAFYNNGYKQWGTIHRQVLKIDNMGDKFSLAKLAILDANSVIEEICGIAKKREKSVYQYVRKLSYKMDDVKSRLQDLYEVVIGTNIINSPFANHEIINGHERRLGLKVLMNKTSDAIAEIDNIIANLQNMAEIPNTTYDCYKTAPNKKKACIKVFSGKY